MKSFVSAIALTIAFPAIASAQTGAPAGHSQHQGHMQHEENKHSEDCCKDKAGCCKGETKMECCDKHAAEKPAETPEGHQGH